MTPTRQLADLKIPGGLEAFVARHRKAGSSWATISRDLWALHDLTLSHETLRQWFGGDQ